MLATPPWPVAVAVALAMLPSAGCTSWTGSIAADSVSLLWFVCMHCHRVVASWCSIQWSRNPCTPPACQLSPTACIDLSRSRTLLRVWTDDRHCRAFIVTQLRRLNLCDSWLMPPVNQALTLINLSMQHAFLFAVSHCWKLKHRPGACGVHGGGVGGVRLACASDFSHSLESLCKFWVPPVTSFTLS
jgi:hypothetical protein